MIARAVPGAVLGAARVVLGVLWILEGALKYRAHFGAADILLVGQSPRVPDFYQWFTDHVVHVYPAFFGFGVPLLEVALGVLLIVGIAPRWIALVSAAQLANYWLADQLEWQYPVMAVLSAVVATFAVSAARFTVPALVRRRAPRTS